MANAIKNNTTEYILCCPTLACELEAALQQAVNPYGEQLAWSEATGTKIRKAYHTRP